MIWIWSARKNGCKNGCQDAQSDQHQQKNQKNLDDDGGFILDMRRFSDDLLLLRGEHTTAFFSKYQVEDVTIDEGPEGKSNESDARQDSHWNSGP